MSRLFALIVLMAVIAVASAQYYYGNYYGSSLGYGYGYAPAVGYGYAAYPAYGGYYGYYKK